LALHHQAVWGLARPASAVCLSTPSLLHSSQTTAFKFVYCNRQSRQVSSFFVQEHAKQDSYLSFQYLQKILVTVIPYLFTYLTQLSLHFSSGTIFHSKYYNSVHINSKITETNSSSAKSQPSKSITIFTIC
jgi:hypothetical protein